MRLSIILGGLLLVVSTYSVGLTLGIGPETVAIKFNEKIVQPGMAAVFGPRGVLSEYEAVNCPERDYLAIAYFGQSNATNTVEPRASIPFPQNLIQYDWKSSRCFAYQEPLLGADFTRGNTITYAAAEIAAQTNKTVVIIPFGFGPSSVLEWAYGQGGDQLNLVLERLQASNIRPQVFLWHQGESDIPIDGAEIGMLAEVPYFQRPEKPLEEGDFRWGIRKEPYKEALNEVLRRTWRAFPESYFGIALVSYAPCLGRSDLWQPLRDAQTEVTEEHNLAFISADSDAIQAEGDRYDTCHFSDDGARKLSAEYLRSLGALDLF